MLIGGIGFVHDEVEGDLEEVIAFGIYFEFVLNFLDFMFVGGFGRVEVEELVHQGGEVESLIGSENLRC